MGLLIFSIILILATIGVFINILVKDRRKENYVNHCISLFKPGNIVKLINVVGHVKPIENVSFEYEIIDSKGDYAVVKQRHDNKNTSSFEFEREFCISSLIRFYDIVDVYDKNENLIERIYRENFI